MDSSEDKNTFQCPWITVACGLRFGVEGTGAAKQRRQELREREEKRILASMVMGWCVGDLFRCFGERLVVVHMFRARLHVGVSKNKGAPKSSILIGFSMKKTIHFGYPYFWKHPCTNGEGFLWCFIINKFSY